MRTGEIRRCRFSAQQFRIACQVGDEAEKRRVAEAVWTSAGLDGLRLLSQRARVPLRYVRALAGAPAAGPSTASRRRKRRRHLELHRQWAAEETASDKGQARTEDEVRAEYHRSTRPPHEREGDDDLPVRWIAAGTTSDELRKFLHREGVGAP